MRKIIASLFALIVHCMPFIGFTQVTFPDNGPKDERANWYAFTNATIYKDYKTVLYNATLIIKNGQIQSVGVGLDVPAGAIVKDLKGAFIYPSFIDAYSDYGVATPERPQQRTRGAQNEMSNKKGAYGWNQAIKPEINAVELFVTDEKYAEQLRTLGFGSVVTHAQDGIARGTASAVLLGDKNENDMVIKDRVSSNFSFSKGSSSQNYPSSLMGSIALIRQTELDAAWYEKSSRTKEFNLSLEAWNNNKKLLQVFEVYNWQDVLRANKLGEEFGVQYVFKGTGDEYKRLNEIAKTNGKLIIPLNFPEAMDMEDPFTSENISLETLKHWEMAAANAKLIADANISFCITSSNLKDRKTFLANVRKAVENGLSQEAALKALTLSPAEMYNISDRVGTLEKGKIANFIVVSGDIFSTKNQILENWVKGEQYIVKAVVEHDLRGKYDLYFNSTNYKLDISGSKEKPDFALTKDSTKIKVSGAINDYYINLYFNEDKDKTDNFTRLSGVYDNNGIIKGSGNLPKGKEIQWIATKKEAFVEKPDTLKLEKKTPLAKVTFPFGSYGFAEVPKTKTVLIKNITVWTCEKEGILKNTDVLLQNGKIAKIGNLVSVVADEVIDGTNKHLTPGIIDEHSHIAATRGVNEGSQASSAEVRMGDVIDCEDVNIYRQLAGGVTTSHILHGSANPIGGQTALIKLRWGKTAEQMKFENADGFIKFALGENVKQSNWGDQNNYRFPQTRMGVEQVYYDYFIRARAYGIERKQNPALRKDLELDALLEILENKRFITCHSYVQSEINMLMHVADSMNFTVNTFTHILEGYKVADKMKLHGAGGSTFSDWWDYKFEVYEAIPYNAALMHDQGVVVAINSDDAEMARRLNQEAAKAVKYGALTEEEALKLVTLNPAKLLHIDNTVGSIKVGKSADVVLWNDNPLSIYAKPEKTFIDGVLYFDIEQDKRLKEQLLYEKNRLTQAMLQAKKGGSTTARLNIRKRQMYECDSIEEEVSNR